MGSSSFEKFSGRLAILAGVAGFFYAVAFIIISRRDPTTGALLSALFLLLTGLFASAAFVGVYERLKETSSGFALWAMLLGVVGALAMAIHGGYDLANAINPPAANIPSIAGLPSQIDPRGLMSFGVAGIVLFAVSWLMRKSDQFPKGLSLLGYLSALLLIILYLGRLIILNPAHPVILLSAILNGFLVNPLWYVWLGIRLLRGREIGA